MSVAGRKDGLPEFSTNHQTTHWLQHWLMKYLSRQSHITCFSFLSFSQTASEKLCCVCRSDEPWPMESVKGFSEFQKKKKTTHKRTGGEAKIWTNLIVCKETALSCNICCNLSATHSHSHNMERVPLPVLKQSFSTLQIMQAPLQSRSRGTGCSVYNSVQYYWWQIMINNNNIDKNGTLALTSDLICRPLCTIWCIEYHNHAWVHF